MRYRFRRRACLLPSLIAAICVILAPTWVGAQEEADLLLLDFHADGYLLAESVPAYASGETFLIDFALFLEAVEFPIEQKDQLWSGWFHAEDRQFLWRMDLGLVQLGGGHSERLESDEWMDTYDGTFVSVQAIERWFNLELNVDQRLQVLNLHSSEPLPFQLWRDRMLAKYRYRPGGRSDADVIVPDQYHWVTLPLVDLSSQILTQKQGGGRISTTSSSLALGMDLLKHSAFYTGGFSRSDSIGDSGRPGCGDFARSCPRRRPSASGGPCRSRATACRQRCARRPAAG